MTSIGPYMYASPNPKTSKVCGDFSRYARANPKSSKLHGDFLRYASANPDNKCKILVHAIKDIKALAVQAIEEIKKPRKGEQC